MYEKVLDCVDEALKYLDEDDPYYQALLDIETDLMMEINFEDEENDDN